MGSSKKRKIAAAVGIAGALLTGAPAVAAPLGVQQTGGHTFMEVNQQGQLVQWTRSGNTFSGQVRGSNWGQTHAITSLDTNAFMEIKPDYRLSKWTWNGVTYIEAVVGSGWDNARMIAGIASNRFLEINKQNELVVWQFNQFNQLSRQVIGTNWTSPRLIAGKGNINFMEVKNSGTLSEWYDFGWGQGVQEIPFEDINVADVRLIVGLDLDRFIVIDTPAGGLFEYTLDPEQSYVKVQRGNGWNNARLIG